MGEMKHLHPQSQLPRPSSPTGKRGRHSTGPDRSHVRERMMTLARIYGFWNYVTNLERSLMRHYLKMFYGLQFRPLAAQVAEQS